MEKITKPKSNTNHKSQVISDILVPRVCYFSPLALRPRLLRAQNCENSAKISQKRQNSAKLNKYFTQKRQFLSKIVDASTKIVVTTTIFSVFGVFFAGNASVSAASLSLSVPSNLSLSISPASNTSGVFAKSSTPGKISISTDNASGYTLSIKAKNAENSNALIHNSNSNNKLLSISDTLTEEQYKSSGNLNTWGYMPSKLGGIDNTNFIPGPTLEGSTIDTTESANSDNNEYGLTLAAKIDSTIPAGSYSNTFIISALANVPKIDGIMQEWVKDYSNCENLGADQIVNLQDSRDDNIYRVAKLADGKCWMIDNLRIVDKKITSADSDVTADFTIPPSDITKFTTTSSDNHDAAYYEENNKDESGDDYGAYYNWHTATAGTGTYSMSSGDATSSICPKGWHLPRGGYFSGDFVTLDKAMGGTGSNRTDAAARDKFIHKPIPGFTYAGDVDSGSLDDRGSIGVYWTSTVNNQGYAYYMAIDTSDNLYTQGYNGYEEYGFSVRCIADEPPSTELLTQLYTSSTDTVTVRPDTGIELIMIADGSDNWKPYYATINNPVTLDSESGRKYVLTVVPFPGNVMTNLTKGADGTITATGGPGSYTSMQDFTNGQCTTEGTNVTDTRNNVSYTVAKIGSKCWMLSNLRLAAGTVLDSSTSNVRSSFTLPTTAWTSSSQNSSTSAIMKECYGAIRNTSSSKKCNDQSTTITEYYYNWPAAKAGTSSVYSGGYSICPKNWTLPNYDNDVTATNAWNGTSNPGQLTTVGYFYSGSQYSVGNYGVWWSSTEYGSSVAYFLVFNGSGATRNSYVNSSKSYGYSVRCMR